MNRRFTIICGIVVILLTWLAANRAVAASPGKSDEPVGKPAAVRGPYRLWTDDTGKHTTEARLADFQEGKVRLWKKDGKTVNVPLERLSKVDREYVGHWADLKQKYPWLDPNAPFDVIAFLEPIPDGENAATVYRDALLEFDAEMFLELPPYEWKRRGQITAKRRDQYDRLDEAWRKDPKSVNLAELDAWLAEYETGFKLLALAQQRPRCMFPCPLSIDSLIPYAQVSRELARVLVYRNRRDLQRGNFERPVQGIETALRLTRDIRFRGVDACQHVAIAIDGICFDDMLRVILAAQGLRPEHCDRLLAALARHEAEASDPFLESQQVGYLIARKVLYDLEHRTGTFDKKYMMKNFRVSEAVVDSPISCIALMAQLGAIGGRLAGKKWGIGGSVYSLTEKASPSWKKLEQTIQAMKAEDYAREAEVINRVYGAVLALEGWTMLERSRACAEPGLVEPLLDTNVAVFLEPPAVAIRINAYLQAQTRLRGMECLVALRRWQLKHRELPKDLETLVRAAGMIGVPIDPYSDQPLRMTVLQGEPVIYSVGPDGKDDKALVVWDLVADHPGDYVLRLTPPMRIQQ
jgi:hypothetical protein